MLVYSPSNVLDPIGTIDHLGSVLPSLTLTLLPLSPEFKMSKGSRTQHPSIHAGKDSVHEIAATVLNCFQIRI